MRDGVKLASDVWLPAADGKYPVILIRTPYLKRDAFFRGAETGAWFARRGYAVVIQDVRGRGESAGDFNFFFQESHDGFDTVESLAAQPWSNGRICMMGVSYLATVQWLAAREKPPHLVCIAPTSPAGRYLDEIPSTGGAFMMFWALNWLNDMRRHDSQPPTAIDWARVYSHRPLLTMDEAMGAKMPLYREFLEHDRLDDYWKRIQFDSGDFARIDIPVLATTGFFDGDQTGALFYWKGMHARSGGAPDEYLTIGPWSHIESYFGGTQKQGELTLSSDAVLDIRAMHLAFFERYLKQSTTTPDLPKVRVYVTGTNVWRAFDTWPVHGARTKRLYLTSNGKANTANGDGVLSPEPAARGSSDKYTFDPRDPVTLNLTAALFASDRRQVQGRKDVLVYTTAPLEKTVQVIGPVSVELYAASDARDTDFTAAIEDVQPDGKVVLLGSRPVGIIRARYRKGPSARPSLLTPGKAEFYRIDLGAVAHAFLPGHRIRLEISSSASPMFNPNQNTGNPIATDIDWRIANQRVLHDIAHPSALALPVVE